MKTDVIAKDCWIAGQLAGIRMLEHELTVAFRKPGARSEKHLEQRLAQLNSWVNLVDDALAVHARSGHVVTLPVYSSGDQLPAA
jgi:hypothetical protein